MSQPDGYMADGTPVYLCMVKNHGRSHALLQMLIYQELISGALFTDFRQITPHYGIQHLMTFGETIFMICRGENGCKHHEVGGRLDPLDAIKECIYLEKLNAPRWEKEKKK